MTVNWSVHWPPFTSVVRPEATVVKHSKSSLRKQTSKKKIEIEKKGTIIPICILQNIWHVPYHNCILISCTGSRWWRSRPRGSWGSAGRCSCG